MATTYEDALAAIPDAGAGTARGVVPVLVRIATHLGYLIAHITDEVGEDSRRASDLSDIADIVDHVSALHLTSDTISRTTNGNLIRLSHLLRLIGEHWESLTDEERKDRAVNVANRVAYVAAQLDIELAGIPSEAGAHV